jgi:hypothetical protein
MHDLGSDAPASHQKPLVHEVLDGPANGRARDPEALAESDLVVDACAGGNGSIDDGRLDAAGDLVVQRYRAGSVDIHEDGDRQQMLCVHSASPALYGHYHRQGVTQGTWWRATHARHRSRRGNPIYIGVVR